MKIFLISATCLIGLLLSSCKGCKPDQPVPEHETTFTERVEKKWTVTSPARVTTGSAADYTSFEFTNNGTFFIIKADRSFLRGDYTLNVGDSSLMMNGVGTLYIDAITDTEITFRLVLSGTTDEITINATPEAPVSGSTTTTTPGQFIGTKWSFKSRSINGVVDPTITNLFSNGTYHLYVILSNYGTYSVETNVPGTGNTLGVWIWCNTNHTAFSGSSDPAIQPDCSTSSIDISFNTNGDLLLTRVSSGQINIDTYEALP